MTKPTVHPAFWSTVQVCVCGMFWALCVFKDH